MQVLVARNKARPLIPQLWKESNPAIKQLRETIEDCWDNDAEARLSAMCIERRLWELPKLWSRYKASLGINNLSPTANPPPPPGSFVNATDVKSFLITNELSLPRDKENQSNQRDSSVSENTIETTVPFSPSDSNGRVLGKNELMEVVNAPLPPPLQPHQGRNPCLERNTINENSKEHQSSSGSGCLIEASEKYPYPNLDRGLNSAHLFEVLENEHGIDPQLMNEHLVPLLNSFLPNSAPSPQAVQIRSANSAAPQSTQSQATFPLPQVPSIPYVQNDMRTVDGRPKRQNAAVEAERRAGNSSKSFWKTALSGRFALLMPRRKPRHKEEEERGILVTPISEPPTPLSPLVSNQNEFQRDGHFPNGEVRMFLNEPNILNEEPLLNCIIPETLQPVNREARPRMAETEIGIAKLQLQQGLTRAVRSRQGSKDSGINKSSENSTSFLDSDCSLERRAVRRPTTLRLRGLPSDEDLGSDGDRGSSDIQTTEVKLRKPKKRIKTPRRPVGPRFSLYDDSVMSGDVPPGLVKEESLSRSLPQDMDALGNSRRKSFPSRGSSSSGKTGSLSLRQSERSTGGSSVGEGGSGIYDVIKPPEIVVMIAGSPIRAQE
ncbi:Bone morphogenetic protein receptor type-2 [Armadillidium nasatum]|uniref:Bone morphogenetic protein receptor type-2 n=1 Tax=Armadillidium nasatum TaxID=96803 RepID=A0A5N5SMG3_9CRUS|nr:Bone morphogenetic protein receptor type-2 [Armadillidium nasatum]